MTEIANPEVTESVDEIAQALQRGQSHMKDLCTAYALGQGSDCSAASIIAGIMAKRETGWKQTEAEICADKSLGDSVEDKIKNSGLSEGTKLQCSPPTIAP